MIFPQIYAAILRLYLLLTGTLSFLQQELMFKNLLFLYTVINVIITRSMIKQRNWNTRELIDVTIPYLQQRLHWIKPSRAVQIEVLRYLFIATYLLIGALLSSILIEVTPGSTLWVNNVASDIICCIIFFFLCRRAHNPTVLVPTDSVLSSLALSPLLSQTVRFGFFSPFALLSFWVFFFCSISLLLAFLLSTGACPHPYQPPTLTRLSLSSPLSLSLQRHANELTANESNGGWSYNNAMFIVMLSILPISTYALFWSVCNMLFHSEFTACPEKFVALPRLFSYLTLPLVTMLCTTQPSS
jgi:hypothetical protein